MNKLFFFIFCFSSFWSFDSYAQMKNVTNAARSSEELKVTGYMNYAPVGYVEEFYVGKSKKPTYTYRSVFEGIIDELKQKSNIRINYIYALGSSTDKYIADINTGDIDIFLGAYYDTKKFQRTELVFPSILNNPVTIITMPENASKISNLSQLKQLKGAVCNQDEFSDYVKQQMEGYNLESVDTPLQLFEKLYTGEVDFVFVTQYFGIVEASKLGIRDYLSFSKQVVWNMPLFIGISQLSPNRKFLVQKLTSYSENPENKIKIEQKLQEMVRNIELENRGVVPPAFIKKEISDNTTSSLDLSPQEDKISN